MGFVHRVALALREFLSKARRGRPWLRLCLLACFRALSRDLSMVFWSLSQRWVYDGMFVREEGWFLELDKACYRAGRINKTEAVHAIAVNDCAPKREIGRHGALWITVKIQPLRSKKYQAFSFAPS
jgi:hypothetical protein